METYFNVAYMGKHAFRTDVYESEFANEVQHHLEELFKVSLGYDIKRYDRERAWKITELLPK